VERLPVILNPNAGRGAEREADAIREAFAAAGTRADVHVVEGARVQDAVHGIAQAGAPFVAVAGGDGTISSAAAALKRTPTALLPLPLGTRNHFAKRYGIASIDAAISAWHRREVHTVPVGCLNDFTFINNASCGFYPQVVRRRDHLERRLPHQAAYWLAGFMVLATLPLMQLELVLQARTRRLRTPALWVGIGMNSLRLPEPGDAQREGEVLEIVTPTAQRRTAILALMARTMFKLKRGEQTPEDRALEIFHTTRFTLDSPHRIDVGVDGEPFRLRPPLHFRYEAAGIRVLCLVAPR
jgi:diacylglycerol kinase family enzyme